MNELPDTFHTDLGSTHKPCNGVRYGRPAIDLENFDEVGAMAHRLYAAPDRQLMLISMLELRALAKLAMLGADAIREAAAVFALSDRGASRSDIAAAMTRLAEVVRPILENATCAPPS